MATTDPVLEALEDAIGYMADIGAVIPESYHRAIAIQKQQMAVIRAADEAVGLFFLLARSNEKDIESQEMAGFLYGELEKLDQLIADQPVSPADKP